MLIRDRYSLLVGAAGWLWSSPVQAETFSTAVQARPGCPDRQAFEAEILARAPSAELSEPGTYAFYLQFQDRREGVDGTLTVRRNGKIVSARHLDGGTCAEVISASALIAALTLDPKARLEPMEFLHQRDQPPTVSDARAAPTSDSGRDANASLVASAPEPGRGREPRSTPPAHPGLATTNQPKAAQSRLSRQQPTPAGLDQILVLGAELAWLSPVAPNGAFWFAAVGGARWRQGPLVRLALGAIAPVERSNTHGESARYSYLGGQLDLAWQLHAHHRFGLDPGLRASIGDLSVQALEVGRVSRAVRSHATLVALGPALGVTWPWSSIEMTAVIALPIALNRPEFEIYVPNREAFSKTPVVGLDLSLIGAFRLKN